MKDHDIWLGTKPSNVFRSLLSVMDEMFRFFLYDFQTSIWRKTDSLLLKGPDKADISLCFHKCLNTVLDRQPLICDPDNLIPSRGLCGQEGGWGRGVMWQHIVLVFVLFFIWNVLQIFTVPWVQCNNTVQNLHQSVITLPFKLYSLCSWIIIAVWMSTSMCAGTITRMRTSPFNLVKT